MVQNITQGSSSVLKLTPNKNKTWSVNASVGGVAENTAHSGETLT